MKYFVWEPSFNGPSARLWSELQTDGAGKVKETLGEPVELPEGDTRTIEELKKDYPCEL